jgi:hypothetical protein
MAGNPHIAVIFKGSQEISISRNLSGVWLDEYLAKSQKGPIPAEYLKITSLIADEFRTEYPNAKINQTAAGADVLIEVDLVAYYAAVQKSHACSLTLRTGLIFKDGKSGSQFRWIPKLVETRKTANYKSDKLDFAALAAALPAASYASAFIEDNRHAVRQLLKEIRDSN